MNNVKVKKTHSAARIPVYATPGAACFDLHSVDVGVVRARDAKDFSCGLAFEIPDDHVMLVFSRSGHGFKHDVRLCNSVGVVDSDYRGDVAIKLRNDNDFSDLLVNPGDRIAQAMIIPVDQVTFEVVDQLSSTKRGVGGFGSTGQ